VYNHDNFFIDLVILLWGAGCRYLKVSMVLQWRLRQLRSAVIIWILRWPAWVMLCLRILLAGL